MANELVKQAKAAGGLMAMTQQLLANIEDSTEQLIQETGATLGSFLQYSGKTGEYKLNGKVIEPGTQFAFNFLHLAKGVICWRDSKPVKRETVLALSGEKIPEAPPKAEQHPDDQWNTLVEVPIRCLDDGLQASFGLSTLTGTRALTRLFAEWGQKVRMHMEDDGTPQVCLVSVAAKRIQMKDKEGKTVYAFVPEFKIEDWAHASEFNFAASPAGDGVENDDDEAQTDEESADDGIEDAEIVEETPPPPPPAAKAAPAASKPKVGFGAGVRGRRV